MSNGDAYLSLSDSKEAQIIHTSLYFVQAIGPYYDGRLFQRTLLFHSVVSSMTRVRAQVSIRHCVKTTVSE